MVAQTIVQISTISSYKIISNLGFDPSDWIFDCEETGMAIYTNEPCSYNENVDVKTCACNTNRCNSVAFFNENTESINQGKSKNST